LMISKNYKFAWLLLVLPRYCAFVFPTASSPAIRCPTKIAFDPAISFDLDHVVALSHINAPSFVVSDVDQAKGASYFFSKFLDKETITSFITFLFLFAGLGVALTNYNIKLFKELSTPGDISVPDSLTDAPLISLPLTSPIPLPSLISVLSRIRTSDDLGDWGAYKKRITGKTSSPLTLENSCLWILKEDFRENIRTSRKRAEWPKGEDGYYGGQAVYDKWSKWVRSSPSEIPDYVLDIVYSTWSGSSKISERPAVDKVLSKIFDSDGIFNEKEFEKAVFKGRALRFVGIGGFLGVQAVLFGVFIGPAFMEFFEL